MATDAFGTTVVSGALYTAAGRVRDITGQQLILVTGLNGENALRMNAGDVVRLDALAPVTYVDSSILGALAAAAGLFQPLHFLLTYISTNGIDNVALRDSAALSVIGRASNSTGDPADIVASADGYVLRRAGTALGFGTLAAGAFADDTISLTRLSIAADACLVGAPAGGSGMQEFARDTPTDFGAGGLDDRMTLWLWSHDDGSLGRCTIAELRSHLGL